MSDASKSAGLRHHPRNSAFRAFRDLRMMRGDKAAGQLSSIPDRYATSAVLGELRRVDNERAAGQLPQHLDPRHVGRSIPIRGRKRAAAKRALRAIYHNLLTPIAVPIAYVVASAFSEGNATASNHMLTTLSNSPANAFSRWFGKFASSKAVPKFLHQRMISMMVAAYGIDVSQIEKPMSEYATLQEFFSRRLTPDARPPHPTSPLVSPCDGELLRCGEVVSGMMVQVKGNEYPLSALFGVPLPDTPAGCRRWFYLFHLRPKDYHRFHAPCNAVVHQTIHLPGYLLPVTQTAAKWVPNLFAELERVSIIGHIKEDATASTAAFVSSPPTHQQQQQQQQRMGQNDDAETPASVRNSQRVFAMVPMGATCVGSISLGFDQRIQTNKTSSLANLWSLFSWGTNNNNNEDSSNTANGGGQQRVMYPTTTPLSLTNGEKKNDDDDDDNVEDEDDDREVQYEFVPPKSPMQQLSAYGQRPGKHTIYRRSDRPEVRRGGEVGWFNWGSAVVVVADLPNGYEPCVKTMQEVHVGQALAAPVNFQRRSN